MERDPEGIEGAVFGGDVVIGPEQLTRADARWRRHATPAFKNLLRAVSTTPTSNAPNATNENTDNA